MIPQNKHIRPNYDKGTEAFCCVFRSSRETMLNRTFIRPKQLKYSEHDNTVATMTASWLLCYIHSPVYMLVTNNSLRQQPPTIPNTQQIAQSHRKSDWTSNVSRLMLAILHCSGKCTNLIAFLAPQKNYVFISFVLTTSKTKKKMHKDRVQIIT